MTVFVDTSALCAIMDADDYRHPQAGETWTGLVTAGEPLLTSNCVLVETLVLLQRRLGLQAVQFFADGIVPLLQVVWVDAGIHGHALTALLTAGRRHLSLGDCVSFVLIHQYSLEQVFAFDRHFSEQGLQVIP